VLKPFNLVYQYEVTVLRTETGSSVSKEFKQIASGFNEEDAGRHACTALGDLASAFNRPAEFKILSVSKLA
jgi:hypothetical protein